MKNLLLAVLLLVTPVANALQVSGGGRTFEEAKHNAFRTAIEFVSGSIVASESTSRNYDMVKNEILVYSAGYIDNYKILSKQESKDYVYLILDVEVSSSKLKDFILSQPNKTSEFESDRHQNQINTYFDERDAGDKLIASLTKHYPYKAYNLKQLPYQLKLNVDRNVTLVVPYQLTWNYNYLVALNETLMKTQDSEFHLLNRPPGRIVVMGKSPDSLIIGNRNIYYFNDLVRLEKVKESMIGRNEARIALNITNIRNESVINICIYPLFLTGAQPSFYRKGTRDDLVIFGNEVENGSVKLELGKGDRVNVSEFKNIELKLVPHKDCRHTTRR